MVAAGHWPTGDDEVAVTSNFVVDIFLEGGLGKGKRLLQEVGLVVVGGAFGVVGDFLKAKNVWIFMLDHPHDAVEIVASVSATNALVDVVA
jgi:hypothetical protein